MKQILNLNEIRVMQRSKSENELAIKLAESLSLRERYEKLNGEAEKIKDERKTNDVPIVDYMKEKSIDAVIFNDCNFFVQASGGSPSFKTVIEESLKRDIISKAAYDRMLALYDDLMGERKLSYDLRVKEV